MLNLRDKSYIGKEPKDVQTYETEQGKQVKGVELRREIITAQGIKVTTFMPVNLGGLQLEAPTIGISASKNIIKTNLAAGNGSVKELINTNDYTLTIEGKIEGGSDYPDDKVQALVDLYNKNEAIEIQSVLTALVFPPATKVVITSLSLPTVEGVEHLQNYFLSLETDSPFELYL